MFSFHLNLVASAQFRLDYEVLNSDLCITQYKYKTYSMYRNNYKYTSYQIKEMHSNHLYDHVNGFCDQMSTS